MSSVDSQLKVKHNIPESILFLKRWLKNPLQIGAVLPSSASLSNLIAGFVRQTPDGIVVELGGGTGCLTRSLLQAGVPAHKLFVVELDQELHKFLKGTFPGVNIIQGNAAELHKLIPQEYHGRVSCVISGMPMSTIPNEVVKKIVNRTFQVLDPEGFLLQYTYLNASSIPARKLGLCKQRMGMTFRNLPPATVWKYTIDPDA